MKNKSPLATPWAWVPPLYVAQGIPYFIVMTISVILYKRLGVANAEIAFYTGLLNLPWVIKPFWSPVVDIWRTKRWWTLSMQASLAVAFFLMTLALTLPSSTSTAVTLTLIVFGLMAFLSATHDIAADGFYMLGLSTHQQAVFAGIRTTFYRIASVLCQGGIVALAGWLIASGVGARPSWGSVMATLGAIFALFALWHARVLPHPASDRPLPGGSTPLKETVDAFISFFKKPGALAMTVFILIYRLPEAMLLKLITPFMMDSPAAGGLGLDEARIGIAYGVVGVTGLMLGGIAGGLIVSRLGLKRCLMPLAVSMSASCAVFVWLAVAGASVPFWAVCSCVFVEQAGYGLGFTAFILCLVWYSQGDRPASHYAIATGLMAVGMMLPGMAAGAIEQALGYRNFFLLTMATCAFTIIAAALLRIPKEFGLKRNGSETAS